MKNLELFKVCPVTKIQLVFNDEWKYCGPIHFFQFAQLFDNLFICFSSGKATKEGAEKYAMIMENFIDNLPKNKRLLLIEDYSSFKGTSPVAARIYTKFYQQPHISEKMEGIVYFSMSALTKAIVRTGHALYGIKFPFFMEKNYESAIKKALDITKRGDFNLLSDEKSVEDIKFEPKSEIEKDVDKLLNFILKINWHKKDNLKLDINENSPLFPIANTLEVIKTDIVDLFVEKEKKEQELILLNELLKEKEKKTKKLISIISHEVRNPLGALIGTLNLLNLDDLSENDRKECVQISIEATKSMKKILDGILDIEKIDSQEFSIVEKEFDVTKIIDKAKRLFTVKAMENNSKIIVKTKDLPKILVGDELRIEQIVYNLLGNAIKFTHNGEIFIFASFDNQKNVLKISVKDSGIGIPKEKQAEIFQAFKQIKTKETQNIEGVGLGLAISKKLALLMNGDIVLKSEEGKGSEFTLILPVKFS